MATQAMILEHAAAMPAPTWHFLKMNDTAIEIPEGLEISPHVKVSGPAKILKGADDIERAVEGAQEAWSAKHPAPTQQEIAEREAFLAAEVDATYGGTAQSDYQKHADALEASRSLSQAFEHGLGSEAAMFLQRVAGKRVVVEGEAGQNVEVDMIVKSVPEAVSVAAIDVVAKCGAEVNVRVTVDSQDADNGTNGIAGTTIRVFADVGSRVGIERAQTLGEGYIDLDDIALFAQDNAHVTVKQTVLGADVSFTGLAGDLRGQDSNVVVDTRYLGRGMQKRDFNYLLRHHGPRTKCELRANGVLMDECSKTLRGTIDLIRGCKGAEGSESETVLLIDEGVRNKTVPVILCNEDDVAGNHGATIGHIDEKQLFYLASRGLSQEEAEAMFASAIVEQAALDAGSSEIRESVIRLGERLAPGFDEIFEEEEI